MRVIPGRASAAAVIPGCAKRRPGISRFRVRCFASPRNDVEIERIASIPIRLSNSEGICASNLAARCARALRRRPLKEGGRRESRVRAAPAVPCALLLGKMHTSIQVSGGIPAFPARWFTAYSALSRVTGLSCHPHPRASFASRELDASVGASGPHGFAVRNDGTRHSPPSRPPHPTARS